MGKLIYMELNLNDMEETNLNKKEFIKELSRRSGINEYNIYELYHLSYELIVEHLTCQENVELPKLGIFTLQTRNAKNLLCGKEKLEEKTCIYLSFQINAQLKNRIKNKSYFSHF